MDKIKTIKFKGQILYCMGDRIIKWYYYYSISCALIRSMFITIN